MATLVDIGTKQLAYFKMNQNLDSNNNIISVESRLELRVYEYNLLAVCLYIDNCELEVGSNTIILQCYSSKI